MLIILCLSVVKALLGKTLFKSPFCFFDITQPSDRKHRAARFPGGEKHDGVSAAQAAGNAAGAVESNWGTGGSHYRAGLQRGSGRSVQVDIAAVAGQMRADALQ